MGLCFLAERDRPGCGARAGGVARDVGPGPVVGKIDNFTVNPPRPHFWSVMGRRDASRLSDTDAEKVADGLADKVYPCGKAGAVSFVGWL